MRTEQLAQKFRDLFGPGPVRFFTAPGRVNLIGEHIDYCGGKVFPAALTLCSTVAARPNGTDTVRMAATDLPGVYCFDLNNVDAARGLKWGTYQAGMAKELISGGARLRGVDMLFDSTLPFGSGLSSSAAIEMSSGLALLSLSENYDEVASSINNIKLAQFGQRAENKFCGVNCGIMDQFASAMGREGQAILLDCATLKYEYVPLDLYGYSLVLANTKKKHSLGASKYNERRREVEEGLRIMHRALPDAQYDHLCDYSPEQFEDAKKAFSGNTVTEMRVEHVIFENRRVEKAAAALRNGDLDLFGQILCDANNSIRYLYEVTGEELDIMYDEARKFDCCIGSRMTGAGFGGCTVNIVETDMTEEFSRKLGENYKRRTGIDPEFYICSVGDGVREIYR